MSKIPAISVAQMRELDRLMVEEFGISVPQMMETAGRSTAELARRLLGGDVLGKRVIAVAGVGNNGGDALVTARYLTNWGAQTRLVLTNEEKLHELPRKQLETLKTMGGRIIPGESQVGKELLSCDLIIDGIIGYNLEGDPKGEAATLIEAIGRSPRPVLAIDVPSGLDAQSGRVGNPCVKAQATLALTLPKEGSVQSSTKGVVGTLFVADMSVPQALYERLHIKVPPIFSHSSIIEYSG
ncbi:NAD(P)H-hydrate epimerase [Patescibacteria group bacterium]|nr:NAD(P)H-hydrate epimerase [Patescibacteria group bacterium]